MVNAGVDTVGLLLPFHSRSVLDHIRSGKDWSLARKQHGLFYLPVDEAREVTNPQVGTSAPITRTCGSWNGNRTTTCC